jgi:signal transduction histidine kinase
MAQQMRNASHVPVQLETFGKPVQIDRAIEHLVLMVAREAVTNAVHHAQPQLVRIKVRYDPGSIRLEVLDDGCGFVPTEVMAAPGTHFGLVGMRERVEQLGGNFQIVSALGKGTQLLVDLPLRSLPAGKLQWA